MIARDAEVVGHRAPLPRIDLTPIWPAKPATDPMRDEMWRFQREVEATRIWKLVQEACA